MIGTKLKEAIQMFYAIMIIAGCSLFAVLVYTSVYAGIGACIAYREGTRAIKRANRYLSGKQS